jgi:hypothetical protein
MTPDQWVTVITGVFEAGGLGVFLFFLIRGLKTQISSLKSILELQKETLSVMERRITETEKVGAIYKRFLEDLPKDLDNYRAVVLQLRDEAISALQRENRRLLDREFNLKSYTFQSFVQEQIVTNPQEPGLARAHDALSSGDTDEALEILTALSQKNSVYYKQLLSGLVVSKRPEDWERAEKLLPEVGTLEHYSRLSLAFWTNNDLTKAISLAERGFTLVSKREMEKPEDRILIATKNCLAYYYADAVREDKAGYARDLVEEALEEALKSSESENYDQRPDLAAAPVLPLSTKCLDTRGYVKITFGTNKEQIVDGITDCEEARRLGDDALYFKHINRAHQRLMALAVSSDAS